MANLPATRDPELPEAEIKRRDLVAGLFFKGLDPATIARQLHPEDRKARRREYLNLRRLAQDPDIVTRVTAMAHGEFTHSLGPMVRALIRRAQRGNPQALKLALEASGFHNPRVKHDHSGEITVKMEGMPRPKTVVSEDTGPVVDADVVED